jgi:hypothetical protein
MRRSAVHGRRRRGAVSAPAAPQQSKPDPLGDALKKVAHSRVLVAGLIAAGATLALAWAIVFALSLIHSQAVQGALGMRLFGTDSPSLGGRLIRALFAPWSSAVKITEKSSPGYAFTMSGVWFFASLVAALAVAGVGLAVRRPIVLLRERVAVLLISALVGGGVLALCAVVLNPTLTTSGPTGDGGTWSIAQHYAYPGGVMFVSVFVITILVGAFSYGVVDLLGKQFASALRHGALFVIVPTLIAGVLFPIAIASRTVPNVQGGDSAFKNGSRFAAGVASASLPLAFGAKATFQVSGWGSDSSPFFAGYSTKTGGVKYRWAKLQKYAARNGSARITGYTGAYGGIGELVGVLLALAIVAAWVMVIARYVGTMGSPRSVDGLRLGLLVGAAGAVALVAVTSLGRQTWMQASADGAVRTVWGAGGSAITQTAALLIAIGGFVGFVYAAYRPSPLRYKPLELAKPSDVKAASDTAVPSVDATVPAAQPPVETAGPAAVSAPGEPARFCPACGSAYPDDEASFCGGCGRARAESV